MPKKAWLEKPAGRLLREATTAHRRIERLLAPLNSALRELLEDDTVHLVRQPGDGWVICWGDALNSSFVDLDALFEMSKSEAIAYLEARSM